MEQFIDSVLIRLDQTHSFSQQDITLIRDILRDISSRYDITPKGNEIVSENVLMPEGYKAFLIIKKTEGLSDRTLNYYRYTIDRFLLAVMKPLNSITVTDIQLYLYKKQSIDGNNVTSVNNIRRTLSAFFAWLFNTHWIADNPMHNIKPIKGLKKAYEPLTSEQFELIMTKLSDQRDRALIAVLAGSGIRNGEARSMLLNRMDIEHKRFYVHGKGNKERLCFLTPRAKIELKKYLDVRTDDAPFVFVSKRKPFRQISSRTIEGLFQNLSSELGFRVFPHKLRHFFADNAHEAGIDVLDISRMLGHESIDTTKIYLTANADDLAFKHSRIK